MGCAMVGRIKLVDSSQPISGRSTPLLKEEHVNDSQQPYGAQMLRTSTSSTSSSHTIPTTNTTSKTRMEKLCATFQERDDSSSSSSSLQEQQQQHYSWIGDTWIPPEGVPRYTPADMRRLLRKENILFVGDSTARQDYFTLYNLMNSSSTAVHHTDAGEYSAISYEALDNGINVNKRHHTENCTIREDLSLAAMLSTCRQVPPALEESSDADNEQNQSAIGQMGALDQTYNPGRYNCFSNISNFVDEPTLAHSSNYSVVVFELGIWEVVKPEGCPNSGNRALLEALNTLQEYSENSNTTVIWKTHGGGSLESKEERKHTREIHRLTQKWFASHRPSNMVLADFGTEVAPRTYGHNRILGDDKNHFGVDARTLSLQLIIDALYGRRCEE